MKHAFTKVAWIAFAKNWLRNALLYLASGYVLFFASERVFWSTFRIGDHLGELALTWLAYSVTACVFVNVVSRFRATTAATVFLAGALYGWLTEGALVGTLYGTEDSAPFPLSLVWTGLSWHALISVLVCWHFIGRALREAKPWKSLAWAAALGVYWGLWAPFLWRENPPEVAPVGLFAAHAFVCTALLMFSHAAVLRFPVASIRPGWPGLIFSLLVLGVFYSAQVKSLGLRPLLLLPLLSGTILGLLWWARRRTATASTGAEATFVNFRNLLALLVAPAVAVALYAGQLALEVKGIAPIHFYRAGGILAVGLLGWAVYRVARPPRDHDPSG